MPTDDRLGMTRPSPDFSQRVSVGTVGEASTTVSPEVTVKHFHPNMPAVYGTPFMIYLMEVAASNAVAPCMPDGWVTVGVDVNVRHLAPAHLRARVDGRAEVTAVTDRLFSFNVEVRSGATVIGKGTHTRAPVELRRFMRPAGDACRHEEE